jgi:hypothetical protein
VRRAGATTRPRQLAVRVTRRSAALGTVLLLGIAVTLTTFAAPPRSSDATDASARHTRSDRPATQGDVGGTSPDPARRSPAGREDVLAVASVSPWVEPDGEFQVRFEPSDRVPPDATLSVTIHQSMTPGDSLRDEVEEIVDGGSPGAILHAQPAVAMADLGDPTDGSVLTIPVRARRANSDRVLLPNPGVHPVQLSLSDQEGEVIWERVVFLNRLPVARDGAPDPAPLQVTLMLPIGSGPAIGAEGRGEFSVEERSTLRATAALLEDAQDAPLTLTARPNTLDGLMLSDEPWAETLLSAVSEAGSGRSLLALPYTAVDTGALVSSGAPNELVRQLELGRDTVERIGRRTVRTDTWALDDSVTPESLATLARAGIDSMVLPATALDLPPEVDPDEVAARPVRLAGDSGIRALAYDGDVSDLLAGSTSEPGARAHEIVTVLMATWFHESRPGGDLRGPASVAVVTANTDPRVLEALVPSLGPGGPIVADPEQPPVPRRDPGRDEDVVALAQRQTSSLRGAVQAMVDTRRMTDAYRSMTGEGDAELWARERINDQTMSSVIDDGRRLSMHLAVREGVQERIDSIELPPARSVVVTSRETTIPLRFRNDLPFDVHLVLQARSPRLDIDDGESRRVVLHPGENRIDLPITVQAPGESLLRVRLSSPVPGIDLEGPDVPVRSTAISGVGAALSIVSVSFLVGWWIHTHRRDRRAGARLSGVHPSADGGAGSLPSGG